MRFLPEHKALEDGLGLKGNDAIEVALVLGGDYGAVDRPGNVGKEALLAALTQLVNRN